MSSRRSRGLLLLILLMVPSYLSFKTAMGETSEGSISFQPSEMPNLSFDYNVAEYRFELTWKTFYLHLEPFAVYNGNTLELKQIIPWLKNNYPNVDYRWAVTKFKNYNRWGYWLENLPQDVADNLDYLGFRLDYNFPLSAVEIEWVETPNYTFPRINLGKAITLDFADLYEHGFTLEVNKTHMMIGNVKGKTDLDLDPITYSAPTITVTGYTEGTPCTFWDIWNASNVNGWDVVNNTGDTQFTFWATLVIGDDVISTWFADTLKQVVFTDNLSTTLIKIENNAHFRIGEVVDTGDKTSRYGCTILTLDDTLNSVYIIQGQSGADMKILSSSINALCAPDKYRYLRDIGVVWNTVLNWVGFMYDQPGAEIYHVLLNDGRLGFYSLDETLIDTVFVTDMDATIYLSGSPTVYYYNVYSRNPGGSGFIRPLNFVGIAYIIDADTDVWTLGWGSSTGIVYRQYTFNVLVVDNLGNPIQNADVTLTYSGQGGGTAYSDVTPANGSIPEQTISKGFYNQTGGDTIYPYEPYNLTVSALGYDTESFIFNITEPTDWTIGLREYTIDVEVNTGLGILPVFLGFMALVVILAANRRRR